MGKLHFWYSSKQDLLNKDTLFRDKIIRNYFKKNLITFCLYNMKIGI